MNKNARRIITSSILSLLVGFSCITNVNANEIQSESIDEVNVEEEIGNKARAIGDTYSWRTVGSSKIKEVTKGGWLHLYTGSPATRAGERDSFTKTVSYKRELSGNIKVTYKQLESVLGFKASATDSFSITKTSGSLAKGEYVKAYYMKNYNRYKVTQRQYIRTNGITSPTSSYAYAYVDKPLLPKVRLDYYTGSSKSRSNEGMVYKTEIYDAETGLLEDVVYN